MRDLLRPFQPSKARPWNRQAAAHLLRRAGFAPQEREIQEALGRGLSGTVDHLLTTTPDVEAHRELDALGKPIAVSDDIERLRGWWLLRMCRSERPLRARMALLWHDHFATSNAKVGSAALMLQQLRTFERFGLAPFEELLVAVSRDPAMIVWLDGDQNIKGRANENYARELFELFSLGEGNYTEADIREAARAFTGWHQRSGRFRFVAGNHDTTEKRVLGRIGNFGGEDVIRLALQQPAAGTFIADKLLRTFVTPRPDNALTAELADVLRACAFDLRETLRVLLHSRAFYAPAHYRARIKSPVEFSIGLTRSLGLDVPAGTLARATSEMGQRLFEPPSVEGWKGHRNWINSATMLVRMNAASQAVRAEHLDIDRLLSERTEDTSNDLEYFVNLLLDGVIPDTLRQQLDGVSGQGSERLRDQIRLLLTAPEYQLA